MIITAQIYVYSSPYDYFLPIGHGMWDPLILILFWGRNGISWYVKYVQQEKSDHETHFQIWHYLY